MHLARVEFDGFRNLHGAVDLAHPLAVLVGANNTGKSSVIDALRMLLVPLVGWPLKARRDDFAHGGSGEPLASKFVIGARYQGLSLQQRGRMITALDEAPDSASIHIEAELRAAGSPRTRVLGGEAKSPDLEDWARSAVTYTYLPPLRDAEEDLRPGRSSRLVELVGALADQHNDRDRIRDIATSANSELADVTSVSASLERIQERLDSVSGAAQSQKADLLFAEPTFERVLSALGVRLGDHVPLPLVHNGLGMNNVLYMAVLLAALSHDHDSDLHVLLVEEPEAHLHPQMQDLLMRFLQREVAERDDLQIIVTTHSPNLAAAAKVERVTSMVTTPGGVRAAALHQAGLHGDELDHLDRFLDVTKSALLFGRAVILVEGVAEQLLLPLLADEMGVSLPEHSAAVISVGGLAFGPFAALFAADRLPNRCSIVSDSDPPAAKDDPVVPEESADEHDAQTLTPDAVLSATAEKLLASENDSRRVFLSSKTFEHDLVLAGNWEWALMALRLVKPRVAKRLANDQGLDSELKKADALLEAVEAVKGRFAQALTRALPEAKAAGHAVRVPDYMQRAVRWACDLAEPADGPVLDAEVPVATDGQADE